MTANLLKYVHRHGYVLYEYYIDKYMRYVILSTYQLGHYHIVVEVLKYERKHKQKSIAIR